MEIKQTTTTLRTLHASEGCLLTKDNEYFTPTVYLGSGSDGSEYHEVPIAEAEAIQAALAEQNKPREEENEPD